MDATITYEFLYDILRKEKDKTELQKFIKSRRGPEFESSLKQYENRLKTT